MVAHLGYNDVCQSKPSLLLLDTHTHTVNIHDAQHTYVKNTHCSLLLVASNSNTLAVLFAETGGGYNAQGLAFGQVLWARRG